jgi:hypothetical protein
MHTRRDVALSIILLFLSASIGGCGQIEQDSPIEIGQRGLAIRMRMLDQTDVARIRFVLERTSCAGEAFDPWASTVEKPLEDILLPGGIPGFEDQPLDGDSSHAFADLFVDLAEGCYRVATWPLASNGNLSRDCAPASASGVRIRDGQTTEIFLINQCRGEGRGAIDVISGLNRPPGLTAVAFQRSKFVYQCQDQVVCATAKDPDEDPIRFSWAKASGPTLYDGPRVISTTTNPDGSVTQCVRAVAEVPERYELTVTVRDLLHGPGGALISFEEYFNSLGSTQTSRDALTFPFYAASDGRTGGCTAVSCKALLESSPGTPSGLYMLDPDGVTGPITPFETYCDMTTDGGGWTLLATVTNNSDGPNQGNWLVASPSLNNWESTTASFGTPNPSLNQDFRSPAFHSVPGQALMITHRNQFLLRTSSQCMGSQTLRARFVGFGWECRGSESFANHPACTHPCDIATATPRAGDTVLLNGVARSKLYFKTGEADGAQDTNKDRTYLSTSYRPDVDYPVGLGAFCSGVYCNPRQGQADVNDLSDAITPAPGTEFYGIWIR